MATVLRSTSFKRLTFPKFAPILSRSIHRLTSLSIHPSPFLQSLSIRRFSSAPLASSATSSSSSSSSLSASGDALLALVVSSPVPVEPSQAIKITDACVKRLQSLNSNPSSSRPTSLRILVDAGGCSGFQYKLNLDTNAATQNDVVFERQGARVLVDDISLEHLRGATIDFVVEMIRSAFVVAANPNAESACGCKASFAPKQI